MKQQDAESNEEMMLSYLCCEYKGLGEMMPSQLWETIMDPERRMLKKLVVEDAAGANMVFSSPMGARVRKYFDVFGSSEYKFCGKTIPWYSVSKFSFP